MKPAENPFLFLLLLLLAGCGPVAEENHQSDEAEQTATDSWSLLVVEQGAGKLSRIDPFTGEKLAEVAVGYNPHEIAISDDGQRAYVSNFGIEDYDRTIGTPGTTISVIDLPALSVAHSFPTNREAGQSANKAPHGIKLRPGHPTELHVNVEVGDSMLVYDINRGQIRRSYPLPAGAHNFIFSPTGDTLFLFAGENGVYSFNPDTGELLREFKTGSAARGLTYTIDGKYLIVSCGDEIYLLDPVDLSLHKHYADLGVKQIIYSTPSPDGQYILAPCPYDGQVLVLNILSGAIEKRIEAGKAPIYVQVSPAGNEAYIANAMDNHMSILNLDTYEMRDFTQVDRPNGFGFFSTTAH